MITVDSKVMEFTGKHVLHWNNDKIVKEEYETVGQS